jgi:serine/threonine-protein kinase
VRAVTTEPRDVSEVLQDALGARYSLGPELGRGGMGVVLAARDRTLDREVAVKVVHPQLADHSAVAERFLAEARTVARLRHPNIVTIHEAGEAGGLLYFVMDRVPGETLRDRLQRDGRLPIPAVTRIVTDLADALDAAARAGVVHRDVKPENVLLEEGTDRALLVDFGVARLLAGENRPETTGQGMAVGTPAYMSPEQATGEEGVDPRSDLYALGVVAYEMLAGTPPFTGPHRVVVSHHISTRPVPVHRLRSDTPPELGRAVMRALAKAPADRWQSGREFREAVLGERRVPARIRRGLVAAVAGLAFVVVGGGVALARHGEGGPPPGINPRHSILVLPFDNLRDDASTEWLRDGSVSMLGLNLSQWTDLTVVDHGRVHDLMRQHGLDDGEAVSLDRARRLARDAGAWTVILGEYERVGDSLSLVARMFDVASGDRVDVAEAAGLHGGDERPLFDRLARSLLDIAGAPTGIQTGLVAATSPSLEAYRAYLAGMDHLQGWDLEAADREFRRATEIDSTFGLAWYRLALARGWLLGAEDEVSRRAMIRATQYAGNLPLHERLVINAYRAFLQPDYLTSRSLYYELLKRDSSDADAWYGLGDAWYHDPAAPFAVRATASYRAFLRALSLVPDYALAYQHLAELLAQASSPSAGVMLATADSFAPAPEGGPTAQALARARTASVALGRNWVAIQPVTLRAHTTLFDALLLRSDLAGALAEVDRFETATRAHPGFALERARAAFVAGRVDSAAAAIVQTVDSARPEDFDAWTSGLEAAVDIAAAANVFAYRGDLTRAARTLELSDQVRGRFIDAAADSARRSNPDRSHWRLLALGNLYAATGGSAPALRRLWDAAAEAARAAPATERAHVARMGAPAALGLFTSTAGDTSALQELRAMAGDDPPPEVEALLAVARNDRPGVRRALDQLQTKPEPGPGDGKAQEMAKSEGPTAAMYLHDYRAPLAATAHYWLGDYAATVELLEDFEPERLSTSRWDPRWGMLGRVRLLRGMAFEKLGRSADAEREYRRVLEQWKEADPALGNYREEAVRGLARVRREAG